MVNNTFEKDVKHPYGNCELQKMYETDARKENMNSGVAHPTMHILLAVDIQTRILYRLEKSIQTVSIGQVRV